MEDKKRRVGLDPSVGYVTPVGSAPGEGLVLRNSHSPHELVAKPIDGEYANAYQLFARGGLLLRPTEPCFGSRVREDGRVGSYEWQTYTQVSARVDAVAAALWHLSLVPRAGDGKRFLGFFLKNCRDWMVCALAAYKTNVVVVPMYDTLGPETVGYIQRQTTMPTVLCTATELKAPQPLLESALLLVLLADGATAFATVLISGSLPAELRRAATAKGLSVLTLGELESVGRSHLSLLGALEAEDLPRISPISGSSEP